MAGRGCTPTEITNLASVTRTSTILSTRTAAARVVTTSVVSTVSSRCRTGDDDCQSLRTTTRRIRTTLAAAPTVVSREVVVTEVATAIQTSTICSSFASSPTAAAPSSSTQIADDDVEDASSSTPVPIASAVTSISDQLTVGAANASSSALLPSATSEEVLPADLTSTTVVGVAAPTLSSSSDGSLPAPSREASNSSSASVSTPTIIGGVIGGLAGLFLLTALIVFLIKRFKNRSRPESGFGWNAKDGDDGWRDHLTGWRKSFRTDGGRTMEEGTVNSATTLVSRGFGGAGMAGMGAGGIKRHGSGGSGSSERLDPSAGPGPDSYGALKSARRPQDEIRAVDFARSHSTRYAQRRAAAAAAGGSDSGHSAADEYAHGGSISSLPSFVSDHQYSQPPPASNSYANNPYSNPAQLSAPPAARQPSQRGQAISPHGPFVPTYTQRAPVVGGYRLSGRGQSPTNGMRAGAASPAPSAYSATSFAGSEGFKTMPIGWQSQMRQVR